MWKCRECAVVESSRSQLLKHYRLKHRHYSCSRRYPCPYLTCPVTFKTWNSLCAHLSRVHKTHTSQEQIPLSTFSCPVCACSDLASERDFFLHFNSHLRSNETVQCVYTGCSFQTNIYATYQTHKNRKHNPHSVKDFKPGVVKTSGESEDLQDDVLEDDDTCSVDATVSLYQSSDSVVLDLSKIIETNFAAALLKLEHVRHVPATVVTEFLEELHFLHTSASAPLSIKNIQDVLQSHNITVDKPVVQEIASAASASTPLFKAIGKGGPLSSDYQRKRYYKENVHVVEPTEYILDFKEEKNYQYIPILQSLQQILKRRDVVDSIVQNHRTQQYSEDCQEYRTFQDGKVYKENIFFSGEELRLSLSLYVDDFEICNPLGTSRKIHKICAIYWILNNLPPGSHSALSNIYLAVLCKTEDVKKFGYHRVLEPLIQDLRTLEQHGVFVSQLGKFLKGALQFVVADNLAAHGIAGFIENFSGEYFCRFCLAKRSVIQTNEVRSGSFVRRSKEIHESHVKLAQQTNSPSFGVKKECVFTKHLEHFCVTSGYPPDILHNLLEGLVPIELAQCLSFLVSKKYFTVETLNKSIATFPYTGTDKTNKPHVMPHNIASRNTIGGNGHENWTLLRLLPLMLGHLIPEDELAWQVLLDLKDIVELAVARFHTDDTIAYLECKITEHRQKYTELFPGVVLRPKHHFVEHYAELIKLYGPLVGQWTMRYEAKHSFFKQVSWHTKCFKNVPLSLAVKHQLMISYYMRPCSLQKPDFEAHDISTVSVDVLNQAAAEKIKLRYPSASEVHLTNSVISKGVEFKNGMVVAQGSTSGLPDFCEILQICLVQERMCFIVKRMTSWYREHYRAFEIHATSDITLLEVADLTDPYPLAAYSIESMRMVTLKRFLTVTGLWYSSLIVPL